jgi:hypothetical protein
MMMRRPENCNTVMYITTTTTTVAKKNQRSFDAVYIVVSNYEDLIKTIILTCKSGAEKQWKSFG